MMIISVKTVASVTDLDFSDPVVLISCKGLNTYGTNPHLHHTRKMSDFVYHAKYIWYTGTRRFGETPLLPSSDDWF
jgi:hypothetical protein